MSPHLSSSNLKCQHVGKATAGAYSCPCTLMQCDPCRPPQNKAPGRPPAAAAPLTLPPDKPSSTTVLHSSPASCHSVAQSQRVQQAGPRLQRMEFVLPYCNVSAAFQDCSRSRVRLVCQKHCPSWARAGNKSSLLGRAEQKAEAPCCLLRPCRCDTLH